MLVAQVRERGVQLTLRLRSGRALGYVQISLHFAGLSALNVVMPTGLRRFQQSGQSHFVTFTCYHPLANMGELTSIFLRSAIYLFSAWRVCAAASPCASTDTLSCRNMFTSCLTSRAGNAGRCIESEWTARDRETAAQEGSARVFLFPD